MKKFLYCLEEIFTQVIPALIISLLFIIYTPLYFIIEIFKLWYGKNENIFGIFFDYREVWKRIWDV